MRNSKGFTLIELMIVVVIIGILAAIAIPKFRDVSRNARAAEVEPLMRQIRTLEERHKAKTGDYTLDLSLLEGGGNLATSGKFYTFGLAAHASGFCIQATANADGVAAGVPPRSMDATGGMYGTGDCS